MNYLLCRNRVRNFDQWKRVFDNHADAHRAASLKLVHLWHEAENPRHVFFLFEVEDIERARAFLESSDATASATESGLIEGDFHFFSESLGYGPPDTMESPAPAGATQSVAPRKNANDSLPVEAVNNVVPPEPVKISPPEKSPESERSSPPKKSSESEKSSPPVRSPESEKNSPPGKSPESEKGAAPEKTLESEKTTKLANSSTPPATMKGPERVNSAPPDEPFEGWVPVENWPPAEAEAEATHEPSHHRRRWERTRY